ncbi:murein transglycosylase [Micromonospora endolithica]|uniref:Murein transglycosylase n=1 Tax=Micromonospora endolithica TaxID=230091 RepID=A0A3A9Z736_9ACTN|nr:lytic transglycosylase domain-containing protein [Micromonospora endolithica]RKN44221.1 murein transglycosylase [Micromonospora endolithica]
MVDGEDRSALRPLRPAAPLDGPVAGSGAAPDEPGRLVPRPRRPWLRSRTPAPAGPDESKTGDPATTGTRTADAGTADAKATDAGTADTKATNAGASGADAATAADRKAAGPQVGEEKADTAPVTGESKAGTPPPSDQAEDGGTKAGGGAADGSRELTVTRVDGVIPVVPAAARRRRVPFAHAVRTPPGRVAVTAARATRDWSRRPSGRLTLPGVFLLALVAATAAAGALLVPATVRAPRPVAVDATVGAPTALPTGLPGELPSGLPSGSPPPLGAPLPSGSAPVGAPTVGVPTGGPVVGLPGTGRPADALAGWAAQISPKVNIPATALQAYGYAELVLAQTNRSCALSWTTLAAIGHVESGHGSANGARLGPDGKALPKIIGLPLDGKGGRMLIRDTDRGELDGDAVLDKAIGPMQFIPTTWQEIGADGDNDGTKDPHDIDDAALAAGNYLCKGGRNLTIPGDWWNAILSYNDVRRYAQDVYDTANRYGRASRT